MSEAERTAKVKSHLGDCNGHLRNIIIKAMITAASRPSSRTTWRSSPPSIARRLTWAT